jgi:hypothetical protein
VTPPRPSAQAVQSAVNVSGLVIAIAEENVSDVTGTWFSPKMLSQPSPEGIRQAAASGTQRFANCGPFETGLHIRNYRERQLVGRRVRVLRRHLDQLLADAAQPSRVEQRTATDEPGTDDGWRDAQQFWGGP